MATESPATDRSAAHELPMFPLGRVAFPGNPLPLHIFEPRYREMTRHCLAGDRSFGVTLIMRGAEVGIDPDQERSAVGTVARIRTAQELDDGRWILETTCVERLRVRRWLPDDPYPQALVELWPDLPASAATVRERSDAVLAAFDRLLEALADARADAHPNRPRRDVLSGDPSQDAYLLCEAAPLGELDRLRLLSAAGTVERLELLNELLGDVTETIHLLRGGPGRPSQD